MNNYFKIKQRGRSILVFCLIVYSITSACKRQDDWLDVKSKQSDVTPTTLSDFQAILDNTSVMNIHSAIMGLMGTDNIYIPDVNLSSVEAYSRNAYLWSKDIFEGGQSVDWVYQYQVIEYANIVLDGLNYPGANAASAAFKNVKGSALFFRAHAYYQISQLYCKPYSPASAASDLGIPLRATSDINIRVGRSTVQQTYDQMINDLKQAADLLPQTPLYKTRPSATASNALLAKIYLAMGDYNNSLLYADKVLSVFNTLLNYSTLSIGTTNPFPTYSKGNPEIIFFAKTYGLSALISSSGTKGRIDPSLFSTYENGDLRKTAFFIADGSTGLYKFKGSYSADVYDFGGIAVDEIYLIRAECKAHTGDINGSLADLNTLLSSRYTAASFKAFTTADQIDLLNRIILERRKEMPFSGNIRWEDLRRLNLDSRFAIALSRTSNGKQYTLAPGDNRYVFPIPDDEIQLNGLQQNPR